MSHAWNSNEFLLSSLDFGITKINKGGANFIVGDQRRRWSRIDSLFGFYDNLYEDDLLYEIVTKGIQSVARREDSKPAENFTESKIICPYAEFGGIKMLDEREILDFINLSKLIDKYSSSPAWDMPLSIAVFGQPGSGKSFSVKEIIKRISPERKLEPLVFNLAQFTSADQLAEAFHKIRDQTLVSKEVPLAIFDEFDSSFNDCWLGWLKLFLAPMQDGLFRGETADYRIGRAIFLFSGGTSFTFDQFKDKIPSSRSEESHEVIRKEAKLDDFIGRLKGYLDVFGPNGEKGQSPDRLIKLRRAIILRSLLEKHAHEIFRFDKIKQVQIANISKDVVRAFLGANKYEYGVRSMEAIIQMSRWINGAFVVSSLPSSTQLKIHVDCQSFEEFLRKD